jgi:DNA-binding XRE family transcriptional regulator
VYRYFSRVALSVIITVRTGASLTNTTSATFGRNLRRLRLNASITQGDLAQRVGLKQQYISLIESGSQNVTLETASTLAFALDQELWAMLGPDNQHSKPRGRCRGN